ncbi:MAG TPA: aldehyde dehydrogenase family protein, partial [Candidatus Kapabacteria bacterium]|nr:aldehyde dehydrogenase family protein [Candidatus Kapabacteria bacterium]
MAQKFQNYIGGIWQDSSNGTTFENRNPANWNEIIGLFPFSTVSDVDVAVKAAAEAYRTWR